jgi:hypothetical protein
MPWKKYILGDENKRLDNINTRCPVYVFLIDLKNGDEIVHQEELDYANYADRKRLGRLTFWAVMHGHSVETMNKVDAEPPVQQG